MNQSYQGYSTRNLQLWIENLPILLTVIDNLDELLERLLAKGSEHEDVRDERIPYWAELWPSSLALSRHLIRRQIVRPGLPTIEIGCGLGLSGIVAGMLGAQVTFTDYMPEALDFARLNWMNNLNLPATFSLLDWRNPDPHMAAPLLLAADVAYEKRAFPFLPEAFRTLCQPGGLILAADPCRSSAPEFFEGVLPANGFRVESYGYQELHKGHNFKINVYEIQACEKS